MKRVVSVVLATVVVATFAGPVSPLSAESTSMGLDQGIEPQASVMSTEIGGSIEVLSLSSGNVGRVNIAQPEIPSGWPIGSQAGMNAITRFDLRHTGMGDNVVVEKLEVIGAHPDDFTQSTASTLPFTIRPQGSQPPSGPSVSHSLAIRVGFRPGAAGNRSASLRIETDRGIINLPLSGEGVTGPVLYRVNSGGGILRHPDLSPSFSEDVFNNRSPYMVSQNVAAPGPATGISADASVPAGTPAGLFQDWRQHTSRIAYSFPTRREGAHIVRLFFGEPAVTAVGARRFDVRIEGSRALRGFDIRAAAGQSHRGISRAFRVESDSVLDVVLDVVEGIPMIQGVEVREVGQTTAVNGAVAGDNFGPVAVGGGEASRTLTISTTGGAAAPGFRVDGITFSGPGASDYTHDLASTAWVAPGEPLEVDVTFKPSQTGDRSVTVEALIWSAPSLKKGLVASGVTTAGTLEPTGPDGFGAVPVGLSATRAVNLSNPSSATIFVADAQVLGSPAFAVADGTFPLTLVPGASKDVMVEFSPTTVGPSSATLRIEHTGTNRPSVVDLAGTGTPRFADTAGSVFESDILWLAASGITRGCNPPANDRFCPDDHVTRGQMAAFFVRALRLDETGPGFTDTVGHVFESDVARLGAAGVTRGCNPPTNDRFCPDDNVTRGQMAAFFVRALELTESGDGFADTVGHVFDGDIRRLARADITRGCNPPTNDRFCPNDNVTRGQMAAFFHRAADLLGLPR